MKQTQDINCEILDLTMTIEAMFPELSKYIAEMPVKVSDTHDLKIDIKNLISYHSSLAALLKTYASYHTSPKLYLNTITFTNT